jgi:FG-GAP repeat/FG-GAP-like repeat
MHARLAVLLALLAVRAAGQTLLATSDGVAAGDQHGHSVAFLGDVNGDGYDDFIVGAPEADGTAPHAGTATIYSGKDHASLHLLRGSQTDAGFGWAVAGVGDVSGDGVGDAAVGEPFRDSPFFTNLGTAWVYDGATGGFLFNTGEPQSGALFGYSLDGAGDWNGDGVPDVVSGAPGFKPASPAPQAGEAVVFTSLSAPPVVLHAFTGAAALDQLGWSVAGAGDVSGGGRPDIVAGAPFADTTVTDGGKVYVFAGETQAQLFAVSGTAAGGELGYAVDGGGDINHDGFLDVIAGAYAESSAAGAVHTFLGPAGTPAQTHKGNPGDHLGGAVAVVGDVDKDGHADLMAGASQPGGNGYVRVWSGKTGGLLYAQVGGEALGDEFGISVAGGGDANDDGWPDLLVGADRADGPGGADVGRASLFDDVVHQTDLGHMGPGVAKLDAYGQPPATGNVYDVGLTQAKPLAPCWLFASTLFTPTPFKGGVLVPNAGAAFVLPLATGADGRLAVQNVPGGGGLTDLYLQIVLKDPAQPKGYTLSNAVKVHDLP